VNRAEHSLSLPIFVDGEAVPPPSAPEGVIDLVENFGLQLQKVQLVAPDEIAIQDISEQYPDFVTDELLRKWMDNPETAPGRVGSSPWPDRIDISSAEKLRDTEYEVSGALVWITSTEIANGGAARIQPIKLTVTKNGTEWKISSVSVDAYSYTTASAPATADPPAAATDSVADSAVVIDNGTGQVSADGGQTWMDEEANQKLHPMLDIVWWTYDEYKEWLEEQKKILPGMIGGIRGYYDEKDVLHQDVWTQEKVDEAISLYEQTLDDIGNGAKVSKYIDGYVDDGGEKIGLTIIAIHPDSISASYTAGISLRDGGTVNLGPFATAEERLAAVEAFCEEQVKAGKMTRQEADKILSEYR
jgi:hypothetical protein